MQNATNTLAATCTAATAVGAYYVATAGSVALSCATKYGTGCATCSDVGCLTVSDTTLYARCKRKVVATGGYATDFSKLGSCLLTSPSVASGDEYTALDGTTMLTSAMLVSNCAEYEWVASTETMKYTAA